MALSADLRIMSRTAKLGLPEVQLGAIPGAGGVQKLIRHVGRSKALEWILLGSHIDAPEAERHGLVVEITEPDQLHVRALDLASRLSKLGPQAIGVLLTGMGEDGASGLLEMRNAGAHTIAEDESTAVVYGMPQAAVRLGAVCESLPLHNVAPRLLELVAKRREQ